MFIVGKKEDVFTVIVLILVVVALSGIFIFKPEVTGSAIKETCFDGTEYGKCSFTKPKFCEGGSLRPKCNICGCPEGRTCLDNGECLQKCSDGTLFGRCSESKPFLCYKGTLVENCFKCGCYEGETCGWDGKCSGYRIRRCDDGTIYNKCSPDKPKYCVGGKLIDNCSLCGCPEGEECGVEGCMKKEKIEKAKEVIEENVAEIAADEVSEAEAEMKKEEEVKDIRWFIGRFCELLRLPC
jgi:hypothetical protein